MASALEETLMLQIRYSEPQLPMPEREFRFDSLRRWRFDFAWPVTMLARYPGGWRLAVEVEGGRYARGRHVRPGGFHNDCEKYAEAVLGKWIVLRFTDDHVKSGWALRKIQQVMNGTKY